MTKNNWLSVRGKFARLRIVAHESTRDQKGITGLETAIVLIAFVVVASVFAYTVLSGGIYSSQQNKRALREGIDSMNALKLQGDIIAYATELQIDDCDTSWIGDSTADSATSTCSVITDRKQGDGAVKITCGEDGTGFSGPDDLLCYNTLSSKLNLTTVAKVRLWVKSTHTTSATDLELCLYDGIPTVAETTTSATLDLPALSSNTWTQFEITLSDRTACTAVSSVGIETEVAPKTDDVYWTICVDDVEIVPYVKQLQITATNALDGWDADVTPSHEILTVSHGELAATSAGTQTLISYQDNNVNISDCAWTFEFIGSHSDDYTLGNYETAVVTIWFVDYNWDSTNEMLYWGLGDADGHFINDVDKLPGPNSDFTLEIRPSGGVGLPLTGRIPSSLTTIMSVR